METGGMSEKRMALIAGAVVVVICIWAVSHVGEGRPGTEEVDGNSSLARYACEGFVKDKLKSPSSADFSDQSETNDGYEWTATGSVDSENALGASIRNEYTCVVRHKGGDGDVYSLVSLTGLGK